MASRQVLPSDSEARIIFMKLPSRIRRSLNDLADAGGCSTLEIVRRFQEGAGHPGFPEPPPTAASISQNLSTPLLPKHPRPSSPPPSARAADDRRRAAKRERDGGGEAVIQMHKFQVGQLVQFNPDRKERTSAPSGPYEVTKKLPHNGQEYEYRIKSAREEYERTARESQLSNAWWL
jgi:hypothetical protein